MDTIARSGEWAAAHSWAQALWPKISEKMSAQCGRLGAAVPYAAIDGVYSDKMRDNIYWWCNGFWPGMLWLMYHADRDDKYLQTARAVEERLDAALAGFEGLHHDVGFMWMLASVADWHLTGDKTARIRALHAANLLAGRYNPRGRFIRAWNRDCTGWIIIDCMMNLSLLYWASGQLNDPRFKFIAMDHADTALKFLVREDGSCNHIAVLDPQNGALLELPAGQGYASGSSWTRGQAWALYGFAISYRHTGEMRYLEAARRIARYFCAEVSRFGYVPPVDFRAPEEPRKIDTSAGAIAACGLLALAAIAEGEESVRHCTDALAILQAIEAAHCDWNILTDGIVQMGTAQYHGKTDELHVPLIYGDYFFLEAVHKLLHPEFIIW
ncbi:MAG: glycoside hydrolase family 88 protein [Spirochaetaceae bacterium]|jgi:unsaturated chondroitin disaccharide hydrolase|nr:glycoside hydrolase family 88 protein [Spirochaetaceae bacterium]